MTPNDLDKNPRSGVIIGIGLGVGLRQYEMDDLQAAYLKFPGKVFEKNRCTKKYLKNYQGEMLLRALKMVVLPLIIFSIIASIASLDRKTTGKLGGIAVAYYAVTTFIAVIIGIILSGNFQNGT